MIKIVIFFTLIFAFLSDYSVTHAGDNPAINRGDFNYPFILYQQRDYQRSATEILRLQLFNPEESSKNYLDLLLAKNYYQLGAYEMAAGEVKKILEAVETQTTEQKYTQAGAFLTLSLLKQGDDLSARNAWNRYVGGDVINQPPVSDDFPDKISVEKAKWMSSVIPGSGLLLSQQYGKAAVSFLINAAFIAGCYQSYMNKQYGVAGLLFFFEIGWYSGGRKAAVESAENYNERRVKEIQQRWIESQESKLLGN